VNVVKLINFTVKARELNTQSKSVTIYKFDLTTIINLLFYQPNIAANNL